MSERMDNALKLAEKCWATAYEQEPEFVEAYLKVAEELLLSKPLVSGEEFKALCIQKGVKRPRSLHHNVWPSGVWALRSLGWVKRKKMVIPLLSHNHMKLVTLWRSMLFEKRGWRRWL